MCGSLGLYDSWLISPVAYPIQQALLQRALQANEAMYVHRCAVADAV